MKKTYGEIRYELGNWKVRCEPHVVMRLKRVFKVREARGTVTLSATPENAYELQWFAQRYPLSVRPQDEAQFRAAAAKYREQLTAVEKIVGDESYTPPLFDGLAIPARAYQAQAADLLLQSGRLLLGDEVGLGKTVTSICVMSDRRALPALVVTLTHLPTQWQREIARFAPTLRTHVLRKGTPYDLRRGYRGRVEPFPDVILANYHKLAGWAQALAGKVKTVIFDEVHELRRHDSNKYTAATIISHAADFRLGLSATPVMNYGGEAYNVIDALSRGVLGSRAEFTETWCKYSPSDRAPAITNPKAFGSYLREQGLFLRRTRADVGRELPPLSKVTHHVEADLNALDTVGDSVAELARTILEQTGMSGQERMRMSAELDWRLRQATGLAKAPYVAEFVKLLIESGERVLLYGWHHQVYEVWRDALAEYRPAFFTGRDSAAQKEAAKQRFVNGDTPLMIMSVRAGAGIDGLQGTCRTVVFGELDWSPGMHDQAIGRIHRDGQAEPVIAYFLVSDSGSDPVVADVLGVKQAQVEGIRDPNGALFEAPKDAGDHIRRLAEDFLKRRKGRGSERAA